MYNIQRYYLKVLVDNLRFVSGCPGLGCVAVYFHHYSAGRFTGQFIDDLLFESICLISLGLDFDVFIEVFHGFISI